MSKFGNKPVEIVKDAKVELKERLLSVEGPKGKLDLPLPIGVTVEQKEGKLFFKADNTLKKNLALQGTMRALSVNMIEGVTKGYTKVLIIEGVGYKAQAQGKILKLNVGFTHPVEFNIPEGIKIDAAKQVEISITGIDKAKVGEAAAKIRRICPPEPYKGKGIRYSDERIRRKVGKAVTK
jgi:large subunit ribosomal protein L6